MKPAGDRHERGVHAVGLPLRQTGGLDEPWAPTRHRSTRLPVSEMWPSLRCVATRFAAKQAGAQQVGAHYDYTIAIPLLLVFLSDFQRHDPMRWAGHCRQLCFLENSCRQICFLFLKSLISLIFSEQFCEESVADKFTVALQTELLFTTIELEPEESLTLL